MQRMLALTLSWLLIALAIPVHADEGMWLPNHLPLEVLKNRYNFVPTPEWTELLERASVRFPNGSGSFVSSEGLVFTNHHIAVDCAAKLSTSRDNIVENGFIARSRSQERKCPDLELDALQTIKDITEQVQGVVDPEMPTAEAEKVRLMMIRALERAESQRSGLSCEVVSLWNGARYHLYCYKKYTDVRLAFIPEVDVARFGGDPDNFEFPRYDLDIAFLRAYENGKPAKPDAYFRWQHAPLREGELVFVSGHPGRTERLKTVTDIKFARDIAYPMRLNTIRRFEMLLQQFSYEGKEEARIVDDDLFGWQNSRKAYVGEQTKLQDPSFLNDKESAEARLRARLAQRPDLQERYGSAWDDIAKAGDILVRIYPRLQMFERGNGFFSKYFAVARSIVRSGDATFPSEPVSEALEVAMLGESLTLLVDTLGGDDPLVQQVLAGKNPRDRAFELISTTRLKERAFREALAKGGEKSIQASDDPMVKLALLIEPGSQNVRQASNEANELKRQGYTKLVGLLQELDGTIGYPDATFTLRLSFGTVTGYEENGKTIPIATSFAGLYQRAKEHENLRPWKLPKRWLARKKALDLDTPFNFVSTADITGGNSGSPVVNRNGEIVGIIFDGNIQGLGNDLAYSETQARAVSVSAVGIVEALRKVYGADGLAEELGK